MYCKKCGKELKETNKFCNNCGTKVSKEKEDIKDTEVSEEKKEKEELKEKAIEEVKENEEKIYCHNCGKKIAKDANVCPACGINLKVRQTVNSANQNDDTVENFFIFGASLLIPFVGIIIWLTTKKDNPSRAHTALVLSLISTGIFIFIFILLLLFIFIYIFSSVGGV